MTAHRTTTLVWVLLLSLTILSWWLGGEGTAPPGAPEARGTVIALLALAFVKARLVIRHFMDVRHAPRPLRLATDVWVFGVSGLLVGLYLVMA